MSETQRAADKQRSPSQTRTAARSNGAMLDMAAKWNEELLRFYGLRMKRYLELSGQLWECKSANDIFKLQTSFLKTMVADYRSETDLMCGQLLNAQKQTVRSNGGKSVQSYEAAILRAQQDAAKILDLAKDQAARIVEEASERASLKAPPPARREKRRKAASA